MLRAFKRDRRVASGDGPCDSTPQAPTNPVKPVGVSAAAASFISSNAEEALHTPDGFHQATMLFCLSTRVPLRAKLTYFSLACSLVVVQLFAIAGVLHAVPDVNYDDIMEQVGTNWSTNDWPMHILLALIAACAIQHEMHDARFVELTLIARANQGTNADPDEQATARRWWLPLTVLQATRLDILLPAIASTAPLLAINAGIDAFNAALNLLAILFVLDADNMMYSALLARHQRQAIEAVQVSVPSEDQLRLDLVMMQSLIATLLSTLCSIIIVVTLGSNAEISENWNGMVMGFAREFFLPEANTYFTVIFFSGTAVLWFAAFTIVQNISRACLQPKGSCLTICMCVVRLGLVCLTIYIYQRLIHMSSVGGAAGQESATAPGAGSSTPSNASTPLPSPMPSLG